MVNNKLLLKVIVILDVCLKLILHDDIHVGYMRLNLASIGLLDSDGYYNNFGNGF